MLNKDDWIAFIGLALFLGTVVCWCVWYFAGSCDSLGWLPISQAPARCVLP